jgi:hypothetical protein
MLAQLMRGWADEIELLKAVQGFGDSAQSFPILNREPTYELPCQFLARFYLVALAPDISRGRIKLMNLAAIHVQQEGFSSDFMLPEPGLP